MHSHESPEISSSEPGRGARPLAAATCCNPLGPQLAPAVARLCPSQEGGSPGCCSLCCRCRLCCCASPGTICRHQTMTGICQRHQKQGIKYTMAFTPLKVKAVVTETDAGLQARTPNLNAQTDTRHPNSGAAHSIMVTLCGMLRQLPGCRWAHLKVVLAAGVQRDGSVLGGPLQAPQHLVHRPFRNRHPHQPPWLLACHPTMPPQLTQHERRTDVQQYKVTGRNLKRAGQMAEQTKG